MEQTDNEIMLAVKAGSRDRFGTLFDRHHKAVFSFFYRMTGDKTASEDLVQEVFLRMFRYRATFRSDSEFRSWMYRIARNVRSDEIRQTKPLLALPPKELRERHDHALPKDGSLLEDRAALLERALLALTEPQREILVLARYQEMKHGEIGTLLGIDSGAVKVRVHRAMKELRKIFLKLSGGKPLCNVTTSASTSPIK